MGEERLTIVPRTPECGWLNIHEYCAGIEGACGCWCHVPGYVPDPRALSTSQAWRAVLAARTPAARAYAGAVFRAALERWTRLG